MLQIVDGSGLHPKKGKAASKKKIPDHAERFMEAFVNILFFSYRKDFPKLNHLHTTTDVGWGCMVRTGQMILAHSLNEIQAPRLSKERINPPINSSYAAARMPYSRERQILKLFHDSPDTDGGHPYSIHSIIDRNSALYGIDKKDEQKNGIWFSPTKIAKVMKHLVRRHSPESLTMLVPTDGVIYVDKVVALCTAPFVPHPGATDHSKLSKEAKRKLRRSGKYRFADGVAPSVQVRRLHKHELLASAAEPITSSQHVRSGSDSVAESWVDVGAPSIKQPTPLRRNTSWNPFKTKADDFDMEGHIDDAEDEARGHLKRAKSGSSSRSSSRSRTSSKKARSKASAESWGEPSSGSDSDDDVLARMLVDSSEDSDSSLDTSDEGPDPDEDRHVGPHAHSGYFTPTGGDHDPEPAPQIRRTKSNTLSQRPSPHRTPPPPAGVGSSAFGTFSLSHSSDGVPNVPVKKPAADQDGSLLGSFSMSSDESGDPGSRRGVSFNLPQSSSSQSPSLSSPRYWSIRFSEGASLSHDSPVPFWRPLFILIPRRLGVSKLNPTFVPHLKATFRNPYSVGFIGGKPKASLYFVAYQDDDMLYLDPHIVRSAHHQEDEFTDEIYNVRSLLFR